MAMIGQAQCSMVMKRDGSLQPFCKEKLLHFVDRCMWGLNPAVVISEKLVEEVSQGLTMQIGSRELLSLCIATAASLAGRHPDYSSLAGRMYVCGLHKATHKTFSDFVEAYGTGTDAVLTPELGELCRRYAEDLDNAIIHARDFQFSYAAIHSMAHSYLVRVGGMIVERPQFLYMRVALSIHKDNLSMVLRTYDALSRHLFTFATPTLANAGTVRPFFASCFLYVPDATGPAGMLRSANDMDLFWLADGGIGLTLASVPCRRRPERQPGVLALMRVYDTHTEYTSAWRTSRPSAATVHLPIWHADVRQFIQCRTSRAARHEYITRLHLGLWIPDVFMQRLERDADWQVFDPTDVPNLLSTYGEAFAASYEEYEQSGIGMGVISARELWDAVCRAQEESGEPFILYQDSINAKNNESHLGVVKTSNLCTEIVQFSSREQTAVCTLASVAVARFVDSNGQYDFAGLHDVVGLAVRGTDALIDAARYPTAACLASAVNSRALGIGAQGLADAFMASGVEFGSPAACKLNSEIFETIYHAAYETSCDLAERDGTYPQYAGSPASRGCLQHDMWSDALTSGRYDFGALRKRVEAVGLRNSMLTAQMPTASTARLLGNFDGVEPYTSNILVHRVLSGDYTEICRWLVRDLEKRGLWSEEIRFMILKDHGSVQGIPSIPDEVKRLYRTAWEIGPSAVIDLAAGRGPFIDQTQSMTLHVARPSSDELRRLQLYAWKRGLKTGMYYLRTQPPALPLPYGVGGIRVEQEDTDAEALPNISDVVILADSEEICQSCSA